MKQHTYGFKFWLAWIFLFAASFVVAAGAWTIVITSILGPIKHPEMVLTWAVSVFGSWFLIITPFMRKKEQIWKRLNFDQEKAVDAWMQGVGGFVILTMLNLFFWSRYYKKNILVGAGSSFNADWLRSVGLSFLILLLPFLILMYRKADAIFKSAVSRQTGSGVKFRTKFIPQTERLLPQTLAKKIEQYKPTLEGGHLLKLKLKDGSSVPNVFVMHSRELLGIYDKTQMDFKIQDVIDAELMQDSEIPAYEESRWLRLDALL